MAAAALVAACLAMRRHTARQKKRHLLASAQEASEFEQAESLDRDDGSAAAGAGAVAPGADGISIVLPPTRASQLTVDTEGSESDDDFAGTTRGQGSRRGRGIASSRRVRSVQSFGPISASSHNLESLSASRRFDSANSEVFHDHFREKHYDSYSDGRTRHEQRHENGERRATNKVSKERGFALHNPMMASAVQKHLHRQNGH